MWFVYWAVGARKSGSLRFVPDLLSWQHLHCLMRRFLSWDVTLDTNHLPWCWDLQINPQSCVPVLDKMQINKWDDLIFGVRWHSFYTSMKTRLVRFRRHLCVSRDHRLFYCQFHFLQTPRPFLGISQGAISRSLWCSLTLFQCNVLPTKYLLHHTLLLYYCSGW